MISLAYPWLLLLALLPLLFLALCPLMHLFMHKGHGGHSRDQDE